ncbi:hypothetical protein GCM10009811_11080 [Nostocoides veronense]|uniref:Uncharacterized protein n=1 Tax=Nostocoides veronense TaxID=330836 RepID=A0ABP4XT89_9MICO
MVAKRYAAAPTTRIGPAGRVHERSRVLTGWSGRATASARIMPTRKLAARAGSQRSAGMPVSTSVAGTSPVTRTASGSVSVSIPKGASGRRVRSRASAAAISGSTA